MLPGIHLAKLYPLRLYTETKHEAKISNNMPTERLETKFDGESNGLQTLHVGTRRACVKELSVLEFKVAHVISMKRNNI